MKQFAAHSTNAATLLVATNTMESKNIGQGVRPAQRIGLARTICIHGVYLRYLRQEYHQIYGHVQCMYTILASPKKEVSGSPCHCALVTMHLVWPCASSKGYQNSEARILDVRPWLDL